MELLVLLNNDQLFRNVQTLPCQENHNLSFDVLDILLDQTLFIYNNIFHFVLYGNRERPQNHPE